MIIACDLVAWLTSCQTPVNVYPFDGHFSGGWARGAMVNWSRYRARDDYFGGGGMTHAGEGGTCDLSPSSLACLIAPYNCAASMGGKI